MNKPPLAHHIVPFLLLVLVAAGCGYYNPNMLPQDEQGPPIKLYVPIWPNSTNELGLESDIHNAISDWLMQSKRLILVPNKEKADFVLNGSIDSVRYPGLSYDVTDQAKTLKTILTVSYTIKEKATDRVLWQAQSFTLEETYNLGSSSAQTDENKKRALNILADDLGEQIYIRAFRALTKHQRRHTADKPTLP